MAFCKTCGAQIPDGMNQCANCTSSEANNSEPVTGSFTPIGGLDSPEMTADKKGSKKTLIIAAAAVIVLVAAGIFLFNLLFAGYKKPIKNVVKGINKIDVDKIAHAVIPKDQFDDFEEMIEDDYNEDYKDYIKDSEDEIKDVIKDNKIDHKVKVDFKNKKKVSNKTKKAIEEAATEFFEDMGLDEVEVKKAYRVKVELEGKIKYKKEKMSASTTLHIYVVKYKGSSGWYIAPYFDKDSLGDWSGLATDLLGASMMGSAFDNDYDEDYDDFDYEDFDYEDYEDFDYEDFDF
ncbi:MAG: zinc ribbon domain-containing protein [Ruminococcus sp.]|nr:zinc ribbon domain-containing protein [Ruminococcus sp.]